ncbi:prephenate dehydratase domain-containing protein [Kitasatospora sp. NPDC085895]|uniref:prephenate dehydratase n=1 Tax=Kitasatospora sp. NPDC085895 TaxID=3155057 RepID=UPI0034500B6D
MGPVRRGHAFLGPSGTFCESALVALSDPAGAPRIAVPSVEAAIASVVAGQAEDAVIPIESSMGLIDDSLDHLTHGVRILRETWVPVRFVLAALPGTQLHDVRRIATHSQAYAQTQKWLSKNLSEVSYQPASSTARAAETLRDPDAAHDAAICSPSAAEKYHLRILAADLSPDSQPHTRFVKVGISRREYLSDPTGDDTTSLVLAGSTHNLLSIAGKLAACQVEILRVRFRFNAKNAAYRGYLWLDCRGHISEHSLATAISAIRCRADLRVIGSYPTSQRPPADSREEGAAGFRAVLNHRAATQYAMLSDPAKLAASNLLSRIADDPQYCPRYRRDWPSQWRLGTFNSWGLLTYLNVHSQHQSIILCIDWAGE